MTRALTVELLAAGFDVTPGAPGSIALDGERKFKRRFTGLGKTTTLVWSDHFYQTAIVGALDDFLAKSVPAIVTLVASGGGVG